MTSKKRYTLGIALLLVYAFFFASTNLFYHAHFTASAKIVHSHPSGDKSHCHTMGQINLLEVTTNECFNEAECITAGLSVPEFVICVLTAASVPCVQEDCRLPFSLRAPPCLNDTVC